MRIAIHYRPGSFSDRWIEYCHENDIQYKIVNCYHSDIFNQVSDCDGLMWHWDLNCYKSAYIARQLTYSLNNLGIKVYPDIDTGWHYDDKLGQKYLLEAISAPSINSYVFYSKKDALEWVADASFPKVFKLRGGAGSSNVRLVKNKFEARQLINKAFTVGYPQKNPVARLRQRIWNLKRDKDIHAFKKLLTGFALLFLKKKDEKFFPRDVGYIYFQDFIPDNTHDTRTVVVGNRCVGSIRYCRKNDFRASGSGIFNDGPQLVDKRMVEISFKVAKQLGTQSLAFDFIIDNGNPVIVEISYCFDVVCSINAPGYWDDKLNWHAEKVNLQRYIIEDFIASLKEHRNTDEKVKIYKAIINE